MVRSIVIFGLLILTGLSGYSETIKEKPSRFSITSTLEVKDGVINTNDLLLGTNGNSKIDGCYWQNWLGTVYYVWEAPHDLYDVQPYCQRFSPTGFNDTLKTVAFSVYDFTPWGEPTAIPGNDDIYITVYDDDNGFPGNILAQETVPAGSYGFYPDEIFVDFSTYSLVFSSDFHVGFSTNGEPGVDFEVLIGDDGVSSPTSRGTCFYDGSWWTMSDLWGLDENLAIRVYLCGYDAPDIESTLPFSNQINCIPETEINIIFDATMSALSISDTTFIVHASQTGLHSGTITYDAPTQTATFDPDIDFAPGEVVTVTLTDGIESTDGIPLIPYSWSFTIEAEVGPALFDVKDYYTTFNVPHDAVPVDYDMDGDLDIAVACQDDGEDNLYMFTNEGNGIFIQCSTYVVYDGTASIVFADFNGDGYSDVVATKSKEIVIGYGNGDGTLTAGNVYPCWEGSSDNGIYQVIASDFNLDGYYDIATCNANTTDISILLNDGDGTFGIASQYPVANFPVSLTSGDIDNDGDIDITVANHFDDKVTIHKNNGDGTFAAYEEYITSQGPYSIKMADFNGDQYLDIICGHGSSITTDTVTVMMNNGDGTFASYQTHNVDFAPLKVNTGDVDGDEDIDIIVANADGTSVQILENDGLATFFPGFQFPTGSFPISINTADFDNDGDLDIVTANRDSDNITVLFNEICTDSDGDHFGDPGYQENTCATDNCPDHYNPMQEDYDLDGLGDSCDPCNNFMFSMEYPGDTVLIQFLHDYSFYPSIDDPDDGSHTVTYTEFPHWCAIVNDSVKGNAPDTAFVEPVTAIIMDACNVDTLSFVTKIFLCGDANSDGLMNILDVTFLINYLYKGGTAPDPIESGDVNSSETINILDITYLINYLYKGGPAPVCP